MRLKALTPRQREVFEAMTGYNPESLNQWPYKGQTSKLAGATLGMTDSTLRWHIAELRKLGYLPISDRTKQRILKSVRIGVDLADTGSESMTVVEFDRLQPGTRSDRAHTDLHKAYLRQLESTESQGGSEFFGCAVLAVLAVIVFLIWAGSNF